MAKIKHYFASELVYEKCCDRGIEFNDWVRKNVEHFKCSNCGFEVNKHSKFCSDCGEKFTGILEEQVMCSCEICGSKFKQMSHETNTCCSRCSGLLQRKHGIELAKAFYNLGKN